MNSLFLVALGGALGAISRYGFYLLSPAMPGRFPIATLGINVLGCFLIGVLVTWISRSGSGGGSPLYLIAGMGFLGAFTTFSTFGWETLSLLQAGHLTLALWNIAAQCTLGLLAAYAGSWLIRLIP